MWTIRRLRPIKFTKSRMKLFIKSLLFVIKKFVLFANISGCAKLFVEYMPIK